MPKQTNEKRTELLEKLAGLALSSKQEGSTSTSHLYEIEAVRVILAYFGDPEVTMAYNDIRWYE